MENTKDEPVQQGFIRLIQLKVQGRLQKGDIIETARLGRCVVAYIQTAQSICVKSADGKYFNISGLDFNATLVSS